MTIYLCSVLDFNDSKYNLYYIDYTKLCSLHYILQDTINNNNEVSIGNDSCPELTGDPESRQVYYL